MIDDDERDEYREELCHDRREREDEGWRNPEEDEEEEEERLDELQRIEWERIKRR